LETSTQGALLFCVVGGKMSEGINFSDRKGRGVFMIGLPFANLKSVELQVRLQSLSDQEDTLYYENLCMRGVNQAIGRAIRHSKDYAAILLVDDRYFRSSIQEKFPKWIRTHLITHLTSFGQIYSAVSRFFKDKRSIS
jgi:chromosome transmission fidelity protein 1